MTNNRNGDRRRLEIIRPFTSHFNNMRRHQAPVRDVDRFVTGRRDRTDIRISNMTGTRLDKGSTPSGEAIRSSGCIPMATPFDGPPVQWCRFRHADQSRLPAPTAMTGFSSRRSPRPANPSSSRSEASRSRI
jgi:hypothetical protein